MPRGSLGLATNATDFVTVTIAMATGQHSVLCSSSRDFATISVSISCVPIAQIIVATATSSQTLSTLRAESLAASPAHSCPKQHRPPGPQARRPSGAPCEHLALLRGWGEVTGSSGDRNIVISVRPARPNPALPRRAAGLSSAANRCSAQMHPTHSATFSP